MKDIKVMLFPIDFRCKMRLKMLLQYHFLKRQYHEIFYLHFFHKSMGPRVLKNTLKYFWILFRFRKENCEYVLTQRYVA
jgi:hypothetical protein